MALTPLKLKEIKVISGEIELLTGLHIGSGNTEMHIGGVDNLVVKHPYTNEPYIPGSSIKGKTRSLLELYYGLVSYSYQINDKDGGLTTHKLLQNYSQNKEIVTKAKTILKLFGLSGAGSEVLEEIGPCRSAFYDCFFTEAFRKELRERNLPYTEIKAENRINRITGTAEHPRFTERVPRGAKFEFKVTFKVLAEGDEALFEELLKGLKLLELDYLGGSGSRGYGRIKIHLADPALREKFENIKVF